MAITTGGLPITPLVVLQRARVVVAVVHLLVPRLTARLVGTPIDGFAEVYARMFAVRNLALAVGLANLERVSDSRQFLQMNVAIDVIDAAAFVVAGRRGVLQGRFMLLGAGIASFAATLGVAALRGGSATASTTS